MTLYPERPPAPTQAQIEEWLRASIKVADEAAAEGKHPFGCVLIDSEGKVVLEQGNIDTVNHAEATLARDAAKKFSPEQLWRSTLVTNFEPCCMCSGTIYWANIGRVIYGSPETVLLSLTGDHSENPTMSLECREVFKAGSKDIEVIGPVESMEEEVVQSHRTFWSSRGH